MTERDLREIRLLRVDAAAVRELIRVEGEPRVAGRLREHLAVVEARRFELMRYVLEIPDARVRCICLMRFAEGIGVGSRVYDGWRDSGTPLL